MSAPAASLTALPYFRLAPDEEIDAAHADYARGDIVALLRTWATRCQPTRATITGVAGKIYARFGLAPKIVNGLAYLATTRAALRAGERFRARLRPDLRHALESEFPWLEHRHTHIPDGFTPPFEFPDAFQDFLESCSLDEARARWQLVCALNEVQQSIYSRYLSERTGITELASQSAREEALALNYFGHWSPPASRELFAQCIYLLDGLNAAVFEMTCRDHQFKIVGRAMAGSISRRREWRAFSTALSQPQILIPVEKQPTGEPFPTTSTV